MMEFSPQEKTRDMQFVPTKRRPQRLCREERAVSNDGKGNLRVAGVFQKKKNPLKPFGFKGFGGRYRTRTCDPAAKRKCAGGTFSA